MNLMLAAISRASDGGKEAVLRSKVLHAIFDTTDRRSVLGTYSITSTGDTTIRRYGVWRVVDGNLVYWKTMIG